MHDAEQIVHEPAFTQEGGHSTKAQEKLSTDGCSHLLQRDAESVVCGKNRRDSTKPIAQPPPLTPSWPSLLRSGGRHPVRPHVKGREHRVPTTAHAGYNSSREEGL
jgi:hypothetical protein